MNAYPTAVGFAVDVSGFGLPPDTLGRVDNFWFRYVADLGNAGPDKAGNATPLTDKDPQTGSSVTFLDLKTNQPETLQANLIMPEPCPFLSLGTKFPTCSIIRSTQTKGAAMGAVKALTADGLFFGQNNPEFSELLRDLAADADRAKREFEG